ncbi:hypothetical protein GW17_00060382 [Ensete ventricosum]|nr:hypothetical protein GW17_00060382 [Ensete ventricosum]
MDLMALEEEIIPHRHTTCFASSFIKKGGELSTSQLVHFKLKPQPLKAFTKIKRDCYPLLLEGVKSMHVSRVVTGVNSSQIVLTSRSSVVTRLPLGRHGTPRQAELATKPPRFPFATALSGRVLPPRSPVDFYVADRRP